MRYTWVVLLAGLTGCGKGGFSRDGFPYGSAANLPTLPVDTGLQIDRAYARDKAAMMVARCHMRGWPESQPESGFIAATYVEVWLGPVACGGIPAYGCSLSNYEIRIASIEGRMPGLAHELWHGLLAWTGTDPTGDPNHTGPCWDLVNGDTP